MDRKLFLTLAIASALAAPAASYAQSDEKEAPKPELTAQSDEKEAPKPELTAQSDEKEAPKPELAA